MGGGESFVDRSELDEEEKLRQLIDELLPDWRDDILTLSGDLGEQLGPVYGLLEQKGFDAEAVFAKYGIM